MLLTRLKDKTFILPGQVRDKTHLHFRQVLLYYI